MRSALRFSEEMSGYVAFGDRPHGSGYEQGRADRTRLTLRLRVVVDDVDRFIAGPQRRAVLRGWVDFPELGGRFDVQRGELRLLPGRADISSGRIYYCVGLRTEDSEWLTVRGVKILKRDPGNDSWSELTSVHTRVLYGEPDLGRTEDGVDDDERERTIATGIVRVTLPGLVASLASFRPRARGRIAGARTVARFWAAVGGGVGDVYLPRPLEFPDEDEREERPPPRPIRPLPIRQSDAWRFELAVTQHDVDKLLGDAVPALDADAMHVNLQHVTARGKEPTRGPVLLIAGSSVGAAIFRPEGVEETLVHRLIGEGYDVWIENWRGSLGHEPREYSLDEAAALDHPAAVEYIRQETETENVKAVVHCLGSASFMLSLAAGRLPHVTHVVSNSVSLHPMVPPGAERKIRTLVPIYERATRWLDPQWAADAMTDQREGAPRAAARNLFSEALVAWVKLAHHEGTSDVCNFAHFMYGSGPSTLFEESRLTPETRDWVEDQLSWAPIRLYRQIARSILAGHLVPLQEWDERLPADVFETGPAEAANARITFITGAENRTFSPRSQERSCEWFTRHQPELGHEFRVLDGFGHLDVWLRPDAGPVHDVVVEGLERQ